MASRRSRPSRRPQVALPTDPIRTAYQTVRVAADRDHDRRLTLFLDDTPSSFIDLDDPLHVGFEYLDIMHRVIVDLAPTSRKIAHLGVAGASLARACAASIPAVEQIGIDIDGELLELVRRWFDLPRSPALKLRPGDALEQVGSLRSGSIDVLTRDIFTAGVIPEHVVSSTMAGEVMRVLRPGGLYLVNSADRQPLTLVKRELATLAHSIAQTHRLNASEVSSSWAPWDYLALIAEPSIVKKKRYGNVVLCAVRPDAENPTSPFETSETLYRSLRSMAVPASILHGEQIQHFVADAQPFGPS